MRVKTKEEFEKEFGANWRERIEQTYPVFMDMYLGKKLPDREAGLMRVLGKVFYDNYLFTKDMVVED